MSFCKEIVHLTNELNQLNISYRENSVISLITDNAITENVYIVRGPIFMNNVIAASLCVNLHKCSKVMIDINTLKVKKSCDPL